MFNALTFVFQTYFFTDAEDEEYKQKTSENILLFIFINQKLNVRGHLKMLTFSHFSALPPPL